MKISCGLVMQMTKAAAVLFVKTNEPTKIIIDIISKKKAKINITIIFMIQNMIYRLRL